ncbi:hypothetical protein [Helicobacter cetorum]|uniref:hypothetical protein n=1 Tax=Helicobacter cetorum TaxID=138563 RepID=UPI000CF0AA8D|nr:hypothetical protein [Helicobacter cetorum]
MNNLEDNAFLNQERFVRVEDKEKKELFAEEVQREELSYGLSSRILLAVLILGIISIGVLVPKIYLSNNIYYVSRKIDALQDQQRLLLEEQQILKNELEKERFRYYIENSENIGDIAF